MSADDIAARLMAALDDNEFSPIHDELMRDVLRAIESLTAENAMLRRRGANELLNTADKFLGLMEENKQQHEEIARLTAERAEMRREIVMDDNEIADLRAERDQLRADAERYRWLRDNALSLSWQSGRWKSGATHYGVSALDADQRPIAIDAAIDAAIGAKDA